MFKILLILLSAVVVLGQEKCDQTPAGAKILTPADPKDGIPFELSIDTKGAGGRYLPDQTYVVTLASLTDRPFKKFMITVEDPAVDDSNYSSMLKKTDVGRLKVLDSDRRTTYSENCLSTVKNTDNSEKKGVTVHWISPKTTSEVSNNQRIRFRAMVAENDEIWYSGDTGSGNELAKILERDNADPIDAPLFDQIEVCPLCSEARYEVIFEGLWTRGNHPLNFPEKPDDIAFESMIGASHDYSFVLWAQGEKAQPYFKEVFEKKGLGSMQDYIIESMDLTKGTRTLIRGKRRQYPHTSEPTQALFRADRIHHMFSLIIHMMPSPDWFLGTSGFELCSEGGWLKSYRIPLYPWDAGVVDGVSYTSPTSWTKPEDNIERVAVGSFDKASPFYQMNFNDLKPFANLTVNLLDVYPLLGVECSDVGKENMEEESPDNEDDESNDEPHMEESRARRCLGQWSEWGQCVADNGVCGVGTETRTRQEINIYDELQGKQLQNCYGTVGESLTDPRDCFLECK